VEAVVELEPVDDNFALLGHLDLSLLPIPLPFLALRVVAQLSCFH
jgi:hypothetical protein